MKYKLIVATSTLSLVLTSGFSSIARADIAPEMLTSTQSITEVVSRGVSRSAANGGFIQKTPNGEAIEKSTHPEFGRWNCFPILKKREPQTIGKLEIKPVRSNDTIMIQMTVLSW
jgi:hypothetical protein